MFVGKQVIGNAEIFGRGKRSQGNMTNANLVTFLQKMCLH